MSIKKIFKKIKNSVVGEKRYEELGFMRFAEAHEVVSILNSFGEDELHYEVIFKLLAFTNLRPIEACELRLTQFTKDLGRANVYQSKTKKFKVTHIPAFLRPILRTYIEENISSIVSHDDFLFFTDNNNSRLGHITTASLRWKLWHIRKKLGINDYIVHNKKHHRICVYSMRRFFITTLCEQPNTNIQDIADLVGHGDPRITMRYRRKRSDSWNQDLLQKTFERIMNQKCIPSGQSFLSQFCSESFKNGKEQVPTS